MRKLLYLVAIALIALTSCAKDDSNKVLAKVGSRKIKVGDFREAYLKIPPSYLPKEGGTAARKQVLDDMVSKELLILEAYADGLDKDKSVLDNMGKLREQVLLQELYDREVISKAKITEKELKQRYEEMSREEEVHARHILVSTPEKAEEISKKLKAGENFEELARKYSEDTQTAASGGDLGFLGRELMLPPEFHDALFKLRPGQFSGVVRTTLGYHIIKVDEARKRKLEPFDKMRASLEQSMLMDKRMELAKNYLDKIKKDYQFKLNQVNIKALSNEFAAAAGPNGVSVADYSKSLAADQRARPLATSTAGNYTIGDFLSSLETSGRAQLPAQVTVDQIGSMVESEAIVKPLVADAEKTGVEKLKKVQKDLERLKEEKMVQLLYQREIRDKVKISQEDINSYYASHVQDYGQPGKIGYSQLIVYDKAVADSLAALARRGANFAKLVQENSVDRASAANGGQVQIKLGENPQIDSLTAEMRPGQIAGPVATRDGLAIIKLVERTKFVPIPLETAAPYVKNDLQRAKEEESFQAFLKKAREQYKPSINEKLLAQIKLEPQATGTPPTATPK